MRPVRRNRASDQGHIRLFTGGDRRQSDPDAPGVAGDPAMLDRSRHLAEGLAAFDR
ncbi:MAG TPA: hypothetical protein VM534_08710 [Thermoanaerobaculia bacterium]|nr:hypothetical protein [Thermoanaerobaculia bacterium]